MGEDAYEDGREETKRRWLEAIEWGGLLAVGLSLYELTNQPASGTAALCLKFGWEDFRTARWLWRTDPWRERGRACWWLFVGGGLWRTAGVAALMNLVIPVGVIALSIAGVRQQAIGGGERLLSSFLGAAATTILGYALAGYCAAVAVVIARKNGIRLWLSASVNGARRWRVWPPPNPRLPRRNLLLLVLLTSTFPVGLAVAGMEFVLLLRWRFAYPGVVITLCGGVELGLFATACILFGQAVEAPSPSACWPPDELAASPDNPLQ